jgi:mannosyltransferase OCH1-like enzyme
MTAQLPIVQYWHSPKPPDYIGERIATFARMNPGRPHIVFNAQAAEKFIAEHFTEREAAAFRACSPPAMQADYLRYCAVLRLGGIWADAGFACERDLTNLLPDSQGGELFRAFVSSSLLMNGLFAFTPGHPFLRLAVDFSTTLIEKRWDGKVAEITGPFVITAIYDFLQAGSAETFLRNTGQAGKLARQFDLQRYARLVCDVVGEDERAIEASRGLKVHAAKDRHKWVQARREPLPHQGDGGHWSNRRGQDVYAPGVQRSERDRRG